MNVPASTIPVEIERPGPGSWLGRLLRNGPAMLFLSSFSFAWMAVSVRALRHFSPSETTFLRFATGMAILTVLHFGSVLPLRFVNKPLLVLRGVLGAVAVICYFTCIRKTDAATATLLNNSYPLFALISGFVIGTVTISWRLVVLLLISFAGMVVVAGPGTGSVTPGAVYGIASAACAGAALVVIEKARSTDTAQATFASMCLGGMAIGILGMFVQGEPVTAPGLADWGWILLLGSSSAVAQLLLNHALLYVGATEGSIVTVTTTAFTAVTAWLVFSDRPSLNFFIGAALILTSAVISALTLGRRKRAAAAEPPSDGEPPVREAA